MSWKDRLKDAAYTSPGGTRITFLYDDVSRSQEIKGSVFDFSDADGSFVQDMGRKGRRYPMRFIFSGADCDTDATSMEEALAERGQGTLEHPMYGSILVVPTGSITRTDNLVSGYNQSTVEVELMETNALVYPSAVADTAGSVSLLDSLANDAIAAGFSAGLVDATVSVISELESDYTAASAFVSSYLTPIANQVSTAQKIFNAIQSSINNALDTLVDDPLTLAYQTIQLIKTPANIVEQISARLTASANQLAQYSGLSSSSGSTSYTTTSASRIKATGRITAYANTVAAITGSDSSNTSSSNTTSALSSTVSSSTELYNRDMFATAAASGLALAAINTAFDRRSDAVSAAETILDTMESLAEWRDTAFADTGEIDDGSAWQATQQLMAKVAGALVSESFDLLNEYTITLTSDRNIIELCYELYGDVDDSLDDFMADNNLSGDEIIELKRGRSIIYYG